jgi:hypothetical protein
MALSYIYEKYDVTWTLEIDSEWKEEAGLSMSGGGTFYTDYSFNAETGYITGAGTNLGNSYSASSVTSDIYYFGNPSVRSLKAYNKYYGGSAMGYADAWRFKSKNIKSISNKGSLIETVTAEDGTYPDNGVHSDGFYYVKTVVSTLYLIQDGQDLKYFNGSWNTIGQIPATVQMFTDASMSEINSIPEEEWINLSSLSKVLLYSPSEATPQATVKTHNLYDSVDKSYHGTGIIVTEMEELPEARKSLMVNAEHEGCVFQYSLDNGVAWNPLTVGEITDISVQAGNQLVIKVELPSDESTLTAISYAWA